MIENNLSLQYDNIRYPPFRSVVLHAHTKSMTVCFLFRKHPSNQSFDSEWRFGEQSFHPSSSMSYSDELLLLSAPLPHRSDKAIMKLTP